jgi:hypothetical protein
MAISSSLTMRASAALSYLSASCPAVAENRKKGRMNTPAARLASSSGLSVVQLAAWKVSSTTIAFFSTLSLSAPRNWVTNSGAKRRARSRPDWLLMGSSFRIRAKWRILLRRIASRRAGIDRIRADCRRWRQRAQAQRRAAESGARHPGEYRVHRDGVDLPGHAPAKGMVVEGDVGRADAGAEARQGVDAAAWSAGSPGAAASRAPCRG